MFPSAPLLTFELEDDTFLCLISAFIEEHKTQKRQYASQQIQDDSSCPPEWEKYSPCCRRKKEMRKHRKLEYFGIIDVGAESDSTSRQDKEETRTSWKSLGNPRAEP